MIRRFARLFVFPLVLALLGACAGTGVPVPQTLPERIEVGVASVTALRDTAAALLQAGSITPADAQNVQQQADTVVAGLRIARTLAAADPAAGSSKLQTSLAVLNALQTYLASKGK